MGNLRIRIRKAWVFIKAFPLKAFLILASATYLTLFTMQAYLYYCEPKLFNYLCSTPVEIIIEAHSRPDSNYNYPSSLYLVNIDNTGVMELEQMYEQSEKKGDWAFWDSQTNTSIAMDIIHCVGDGTMRTTVRLANPRGLLSFLKGVECGSVSVTCGTETRTYNLYEDPTAGNVLDVPCSLRYKSVADILCVGLGAVVFLLWLAFSAFCLRTNTGKAAANQERTEGHQPGPDLIRAYAVASVAFIHGLLNSQYYTINLAGVAGFLTTVLRWGLFPCAVLFFMLSGFFLRKKKLSVQWYRRLASLIITYLVATLLCVTVQSGTNTGGEYFPVVA